MEKFLKYKYEQDKLLILIIGSMLFHVVILFSFYFFGTIDLPFFLQTTREINIKLAKASVRVDVVKMPELTVKELKSLSQLERNNGDNNPRPVVEKKDEVAPDEDAFLKKKEKTDFMSMLKSLSEQKVDHSKIKPKKEVSGIKKNKSNDIISNKIKGKLKELVIAGNKLGKGTAIVGSENSEALSKLDLYASVLPEHVRPFWKLPGYLLQRDLTCRIKLYLSPSGELLKANIFESSGEDEYDRRALDAVNRASPFPPLPDDISAFGGRGVIVLGFPL